MAIEFTGVLTTLAAADTEVNEYNLALAALNGAKGELVASQEVVVVKQGAVTAAGESVSSEKTDVVRLVTEAIAQLTAILTGLQE